MPGIIVGLDGSGHSQRALDWAAREAALRDAALTVVVVHPLMRGYSGRGVEFAGDAELATKAGEEAKAETESVLAGLGKRPPSVDVQVRSGVPAQELIEATKDADMIVLGSRGVGGFAQLLMGSVSAQVAHHAHCPVVIIPGEHRHGHHD
jgi:nucleotide-binding universal stress UspA family protein